MNYPWRTLGHPSADQALVLKEGRIVERGTHDELLDAGGLYCTPISTIAIA